VVDTAVTVRSWLDVFDVPDACAAQLLCDRHDPGAVAFTFVEPDLSSRDVTFGELADLSARFAAMLAERGIGAGDGVAVLMGKRIELVVTVLALWRLGAVHVPLFTAFAAPAIQMRVQASRARLIITEPSQRAKAEALPDVTVIEVGPELDAAIARSQPLPAPAVIGADGPLIHLFTSGTTGRPKAVPVPVKALASFTAYLHYGLDVRADDVFWNAADPGWAYGLYYGVVGPLVTGRRNLLFNAGFTADSTAAVLTRFEVTNFAGAPTVYRALSKAASVAGINLRRASSAGEPLTPDVAQWSVQALGVEVRDQYGQTEQGMVIVNGWHDDVRRPVKPGSMGRPLPGFAAGVVDDAIALDVPNSPLMWFTGYVEDAERTAERFTPDGRWYLTGDTGRVDEDGDFFFTARDDDVIIMAGYRIGPFDVESVLINHPDVVDVAVVGRPDEIRGEVVEAFVVLREGVIGSDELAADLQQLVRDGYSAHAYPRQVHFVQELPKTPSGKIQRYILRRPD
jgi:acetyl-CoA synthetase